MNKNIKNYFILLLLIKILYTYFFLNIYINFSTIGDAKGFLKRRFIFDLDFYFPNIFFNRTFFVETIYGVSNSIFSKHLTPYLFSSLSFFIIWHSLKTCINFNKKKNILFLIIFFTPSLSLWTSVPSKELITVTLFIYLCSCYTRMIYEKKINYIIFILSLIIVAYVRPNYFIIYGFFLMIIIFKKITLDQITNKFNFFISFKFYFFIFFIFFMIIILLYLLTSFFFDDYIKYIMYKSYYMFKSFEHMSSSMRNINLEWSEVKSFYSSLILGAFISFSGPSINDMLNRPIYIIHFLESLVINISIIYLILRMLNLSKNIQNFPFLFFFGILSCYVLGLIIHYPLGLFNIGSSLRYKQNLIPIFIILPYMLINFKNKN
jgi:hypothetical protein